MSQKCDNPVPELKSHPHSEAARLRCVEEETEARVKTYRRLDFGYGVKELSRSIDLEASVK